MAFVKIYDKLELAVNLDRTAENTIQIQEGKPNEAINHASSIVQGGSVFAVVVFWTGCLIFLAKKMKATPEERSPGLAKKLQHLPCHKCQYFSNNGFLKCAVNPSIVLTEEARNCSDYCPKHDKFEQ